MTDSAVDGAESWQPARLIPVSGITGPDEQERRGVSALLAVVASVREFGRALTSRFGAPAGAIETYIEVPFLLGERHCRPDGLIRVTRGSKTWTVLVEVKTGKNTLEATQVETYLDIAREQDFDGVLTISNEIEVAPGVHPVTVDKRKLRRVALYHLAWSQIHTEAIIEKVNRSVSDPDQAWILGEFVRYLEYPKSGAVDFEDMGPAWVTVRDAAVTRTLRATDKGAREVVAKFEQLVSYAGMRLSRQLGVEVRPALSRRELAAPDARLNAQVGNLVDHGRISGSLMVPFTIAPMVVTADLHGGRVARARQAGPNYSLAELQAEPKRLLSDAKSDIRGFRLTSSRLAGPKRGQGRGSFVASVLDVVDQFYVEVVQSLKPWSPPVPQVKAPIKEDTGPGTSLPLAQVADAADPPAAEAAPGGEAPNATEAAASRNRALPSNVSWSPPAAQTSPAPWSEN
jgi:hypothetical protein